MILYKANVKWYDDFQEEDHVDTVFGFAETLSNFADRIEKEFNYINEVEITAINIIASDNQLLYVANDDINTINAIKKENDY